MCEMNRLPHQLIAMTVLSGVLLITGNAIIFAAESGVDITTRNGVTYKNCRVISVATTSICFVHAKGTAIVSFSEMPDQIQTKYNYTSTNAAAYLRSVEQ